MISSCSDDEGNKIDYEALMKTKCDSVVTNTDVPGIAIKVKAPGKDIDFIYAVGEADIDNHLPMRSDMTHRIGSVTKTFVVTVMLQLVDAGLLSLDTPLSAYYPEIPYSEIITMEMLSSMTSGIKEYMETEEFSTILINDLTQYFAPDSLINYAVRAGVDFYPGTNWHYCNTNLIIIGRIIEKITGNELKTELENRIFNELGMTDTEFLNGGTAMPGDHPQGYYSGVVDSVEYNYTEVLDISVAWAAGSIVSTLADLQVYVDALINGELISSELQQLRLECQHQVPGKIIKYGIGLVDYNDFYGHNGGFFGFTTSCYKSLEKDCSIIIFYNSYIESNQPDKLFEEIAGIIYPEIIWE
jgi:D-alanyl-D-alanine carboxypeptidase